MGIIKRIANLCQNGQNKRTAKEGEEMEKFKYTGDREKKPRMKPLAFEVEIVMERKEKRKLARMFYRMPGNNYRKLQGMPMRRFNALEKAVKRNKK